MNGAYAQPLTAPPAFAYSDGKMTDLAHITEQKDYIQAKLTPFAEWVK